MTARAGGGGRQFGAAGNLMRVAVARAMCRNPRMHVSHCVFACGAVLASASVGCAPRAAAPASAAAPTETPLALATPIDAGAGSTLPIDAGAAPRYAASDVPSFELTVRVRGGGAFAGGVRSEPVGIDCHAANQQQDVVVECAARFVAGQKVTLHHVAGGAAHLGQFHLERGARPEKCKMTDQRCELVLDADTVVTVYPISVPPPPPPP